VNGLRSAWTSPLLAIPLLVLGLLAVARLARVKPALRPLVLPYALAALAGSFALLGGRADPFAPGWLSLFVLLPVLVLCVRASVILLQELFRRSSGESPPSLLESVVAVLLYAIGGGVIAHRWLGLELGPFLAGSAVVGAVVGLALQETLGNLFAGVALHTEAPFQVGDWVRLGEREGRVEQVSWRAMRLRTWFGDTLTIPNNEAARHSIVNFSQPREPHSRLVTIGVNYNTPPNKVITVLGHLLEQIPQLPPQPAPVIRVVGYEDFSIQYEIRYFLSDYEDYRAVEGEIFRLIWYHFRRHGIAIPFPIRDVYLHQPDSGEAPREQAETRLMRALRAIDLFRPLSDEELRLAAANFRQLHYAAGERLIEEGSTGEGFFVIDRGEVEVTKEINGKRRTLARLMEGQFFGEMALLTGEPRSATVVALTDVDVFTIDKPGFHNVLVKNPAIAVDISAILSERQEALVQAKGDVTAKFDSSLHGAGELKNRILDRIRSYFGL
jgi:small-conductance mechanosensitive channel/CRP-like cAMP-binding protein